MKISIRLLKEKIRQDFKSNNGPFVWNEFVKLALNGDPNVGTDLESRIESANWYAKWRLKKIGSGMARNVYVLNSKSVLKIADDIHDGIIQNQNESKIMNLVTNDMPIAKVLRKSNDDIWIVSELVKPMTNESQFVKLTNRSFLETRNILEEIKQKTKNNQKLNENDYDKFILKLWDLIDILDLAIFDVCALQNWGVNVNGDPVLLDAGFSDDMKY